MQKTRLPFAKKNAICPFRFSHFRPCWSFKAACRNHRRHSVSLHFTCSLALSDRLEIMWNREIPTIPPFGCCQPHFHCGPFLNFYPACSSDFVVTSKLSKYRIFDPIHNCYHCFVRTFHGSLNSLLLVMFVRFLPGILATSSTAVFENESVLAWNLVSKLPRSPSLSCILPATFPLFSPRLVSDSWKIPTHAFSPLQPVPICDDEAERPREHGEWRELDTRSIRKLPIVQSSANLSPGLWCRITCEY